MDHRNDAINDTSADFGSFDRIKDYYYAHPIIKNAGSIAGASSFVTTVEFDFPADFGSFDRIKDHYYAHPIFKNAGSIAGASSTSRNVRNKPKPETTDSEAISTAETTDSEVISKAETTDSEVISKAETTGSEVICTRSLFNGRLSRRQRGCIAKGHKFGKLGSRMFESHIESIWRKLSQEKKNEFTYLDSLWFSLHANESFKAKVLSWIKKRDIFLKKYVFVPIVKWDHWFLLIFCHFGEDSEAKSKHRCMLLLDSLQNANSKQLEPGIRRFVFDIFQSEERPESRELIRKIPLLIPKVPQQKNGEECGFFVLYYIKQFLESAPDSFSFSTGCPHFMKKDWFTPKDVECFVESLDSEPECSD